MKKFDMELYFTQIMGDLKEYINNLEELYGVGAFQLSLAKVSNVFELLKNMRNVYLWHLYSI